MYQTGYKAALKRNKITADDLLKSARESYDEVVHLESELKKQREELVDAHKDDRPQMVADIEKAETVLAKLDEHLCKKIDGNEKMRAKVINMQAQRGKGKKDKPVVVAADGTMVGDDTPPVDTPIATPDPVTIVVPDQTPAPVEAITYTSAYNGVTSKFDVTSSNGEVVGSFDTQEEADKKIIELSAKNKSGAWKWWLGGVLLAGLAVTTGVIITNQQAGSFSRKKWF